MRIVYGDLPELVEPVAKGLVERWAFMLPSWVIEFVVDYDDTNNDDYASTSGLYEQRLAVITIHPPLLSLDAEARAQTWRHELGHVLTSPLDELFESIVGNTLKGSELARAREAYRRESEGVVTDIGAAFARQL